MRTGFLIIGYGVLFVTRFIIDLDLALLTRQNKDDIWMKLTKSISITVFNAIWIALYVFVFEIQKIKLTLRASNATRLKNQLKRKNCVNGAILGIYIVGEILYTSIEIAIYFTTNNLSPKTSVLAWYRTIVLLILRVSDLYLSIMFITIIYSYY
jgi:hypothetical protein